MNQLPLERQAAIVHALVEGNSLPATARLTGTSKNTVAKLLKDLGAHCKNHHDRMVRGVSCTRVQCDEIWAFCGSKEKNTTPEKKAEGNGDVWTWTGICQDSKLILSYLVGDRDAPTAHEFVQDLAGRLATRIQLTTDGMRLYLTAVEKAFGWGKVDYAMLVKLYGAAESGRYSAAECIGVDGVPVMGIQSRKTYARRM